MYEAINLLNSKNNFGNYLNQAMYGSCLILAIFDLLIRATMLALPPPHPGLNGIFDLLIRATMLALPPPNPGLNAIFDLLMRATMPRLPAPYPCLNS